MILPESARTLITGACIALAATGIFLVYSRHEEAEIVVPDAAPLRYRPITAVDIHRAYADGTSAADRRFRNVHWSVSGTIREIKADSAGAPVLVLEPGVECLLPRSAAHTVELLSKGKTVEMPCAGLGKRERPLMECTLK